MRRENYIKLIVNILVFIIGILLATTSFGIVDSYDVYKDDVGKRIKNGRLAPYEEGGGIFYCGQSHAAYKASLTLAESGGYDNKEGTHYKDEVAHDSDITGNTFNTGITKQSMKYTKRDRINDQSLSYALATAKARGYDLMDMGMAYTIWGLPINRNGSDKTSTALSKEARAYLEFYNSIKDGFKLEDQTVYEKNRKPSVAVDAITQKYTIGTFKIKYPKGDYQVDGNSNNNTSNNVNESEYGSAEEYITVYKEKLAKLMSNSNKIYNDLQRGSHSIKIIEVDGEERYDFSKIRYKDATKVMNYISVHEDITKYLQDGSNFTGNDKEKILNTIKSKISKLQEVVGQLKFKNNKSEEYLQEAINKINNYKEEKSEIKDSNYTTPTISGTKFSYVKKMTLIGIDENGNERELLYNDINHSPIEVLKKDGNPMTTEVVSDENTGALQGGVSLPQNEQEFYVRFKLPEHSEDIKKVKIKVEVRYLKKCDAEAYWYESTVYNWSWADEDTATVCHYVKCDGKENGEPYHAAGSHDTKTVEDYKHRAVLRVQSSNEARQWLIGVPGSGNDINASKTWKKEEVTLGGDGGIDITMELGGHAFIDEDQGKVNTGDNLFKDKKTEALANVEVWLYECDINGEHEKFTGKIMTTMGEDENGSYVFTQLDAMKKYRVKFVYNGLLYANVDNKLLDAEYNSEEWKQTSKVDELDRDGWNNRFKEIGSYPQNYEIVNKGIFPELGKYNIAYPQEEIVTYFQEISANMAANGGDLKKACETVRDNYIRKGVNEEEAKRKTQFAADCRIEAWTNKDKVAVKDPYGGTNSTYIYPVYDKFTLDGKDVDANGEVLTIGQGKYKPIYQGQKFINCGIKNRSKIDLELYKDVFKAEITINGKQEIYEYDARRKGKNNARFEIGKYDSSKEQTEGSATFLKGIEEDKYNQEIRTLYRDKTKTFTNNERTREVEDDYYTLNMREEEANNGLDNTSIQSQYAGHNNYSLVDPSNPDRLKVFITYKIALRNNGSEPGIITEIADYYDNNYTFARAYLADEDGSNPVELNRDDTNQGVGYSENSKYGTATQYKSNTDKNAYKTMYIRVGDLELTSKDKEQYLYVVLQLFKPNEKDAGQILMSSDFVNGSGLTVINLAEINGYKNVNGLLDKDSNPGNLNISNIDALAQDKIVNYLGIRDMYEDDTDRAPAFIFTKYAARTVEGQVFEDATGKDGEKIHTKNTREGDGELNGDQGIRGVQVELIEIKNNKMEVRATTRTNDSGWYGFVGFLPGDYTIRYTYGADNATAMTTSSKYSTGWNAKSYNGQDFQSTKYSSNSGNVLTPDIDENIKKKYETNNTNRNAEETSLGFTAKQSIAKHKDGDYWYNQVNKRLSDAEDYSFRKQQVIAYSKEEYKKDNQNTEIVNHKAEVFNAYESERNLPEHIKQDQGKLQKLAEELERRTYRYAYTPMMEIEVEYATKTKVGNTTGEDIYTHKITNVDFGIVERPRSELVIDQDVKHIKVTAADGVTVLFDTDRQTNNLQWIKGKQPQEEIRKKLYKGNAIETSEGYSDDYDKNELLNVIMDEELIDGATLEVTYNIKVTNNGEKDYDVNGQEVTTRAKNIINYVSNNLTFDEAENQYWEVVKLSDIQNDKNSTWIHQKFSIKTGYADEDTFLDLSNQQVILKATTDNPLTKTTLRPGESTPTVQLKLKKKMSTEGANDNLTYTNMSEIVEIENTVGRYDHGATPGNQDINYEPQEHDTSGASYYSRPEEYPDYPIPETNTPQDGRIIVTPPTGSTHIYYWIGIAGTLLLAVGIYLIKKFVLDNRK